MFVTAIVALSVSISIFAPIQLFGEDYKSIDNMLKSWFEYDNASYDKIRQNKEFGTEYDFLNNSIGTTLNSLREKYDINDQKQYQNLKNNLFKNTNLTDYGYGISDNEWINDDVELICVVDKKTKKHNIYKLNYREYALENSSDEEFTNTRNANRAAK